MGKKTLDQELNDPVNVAVMSKYGEAHSKKTWLGKWGHKTFFGWTGWIMINESKKFLPWWAELIDYKGTKKVTKYKYVTINYYTGEKEFKWDYKK
jgi:hypothetical protein